MGWFKQVSAIAAGGCAAVFLYGFVALVIMCLFVVGCVKFLST